MPPPSNTEQEAAIAFDNQSAVFDELYGSDSIINYKRSRVRDHVLKFLPPSSKILELNAGTGEDAIFFAQLGHKVHATDISAGMQEQLKQKVEKLYLPGSITNEICSYTALDTLENKGPYDLIFSNFAGLNCTDQLTTVLKTFSSLLNPGGLIVMVILPKFCLWEFLLIFKGKFRVAFRRFFSANGRKAHINGSWFTCWYHSPKLVEQTLKENYSLLELEGLCTIVPPSYIEHFAEKHPKLFSYLRKQEDKRKDKWPWKYVGDYYIISFKKND